MLRLIFNFNFIFVALEEATPLESSFNNTLLDMSLYFECGGGEIISIIGICNGKIDCISGRDEEHCQNSSKSKI